MSEEHHRVCVICEDLFTTKDADIWWCSKKCHHEVLRRGEIRRREQLQLAKEVQESVPEAVSEADKARAFLSGSSTRVDEPRADEEIRAYLEASSVLASQAMRMPDPDDAYLLTSIALGYLDRVQDRLEALGARVPDVRSSDDVPFGFTRKREKPS